MAKSVLSAPHFQTEEAAFAYVEAALWPNGPVCPFCGERERIGALKGKTTRPGLRKCYSCKKPFTVRIGTIFEGSHLALHLWLQVIHLMCASKKGISTRQIQRMLQCSMKTAWFLTHRIREAMKDNNATPLGGSGKVVEADETYHGPKDVITKRTRRGKASHSSQRSIVALVERGGRVRSFYVERVTKAAISKIVIENASRESRLHTDESRLYTGANQHFAEHQTVKHSANEYARGDVNTNSIEGYFSIFKRGMKGIYQHCGEQHLHRYLAEFDFRYSNREATGFNDVSRADAALKGFKGKRLTYRTTGGETATV